MDDVVDAMLDDYIPGTRHIHLDGKTYGSLEPVGLIGDTVVLPQDARAAHRTADDGHMAPPILPGTQG